LFVAGGMWAGNWQVVGFAAWPARLFLEVGVRG